MQMQRTRPGAFVVASLVLAVVAPTARATNSPGMGVANARRAGIEIDPAVVPLMLRAPVGTCENDPTLDGCPEVDAMVYAPEFFGIHSEPARVKASSARVRRLRAHAPRARIGQSALDQCGVKVSDQSPYKVASQAQLDAQSRCNTSVSDNDIYLSLSKYGLNSNSWNVITSRWIGHVTQGITHYYHLAIGCASTPLRAWRAQIDGYALLEGVWYAGTQAKYNNLRCNYP